VEFHYLLLTVLAGYRAGLELLGNEDNLGNASGTETYAPEDYDLAWIFTLLLWRIAHSSMLRDHLVFLHTAGLLSPAAPGNSGMEADNLDGRVKTRQKSDKAAIWLHIMMTRNHHLPGEGHMFLYWIHLLVSDLTALETLSHFFISEIPNHMTVHIHPIALRPRAPAGKVFWKPVIERALQSQNSLHPHYDAIVTTLIECINKDKESTEKYIYHRYFTDETMTVTGSVHCEAALACIMKYPGACTSGMDIKYNVCLFQSFKKCNHHDHTL
jgi:hypothetical protein